MPQADAITIEGYTVDDLLTLPDEQVNEFVFVNAPVTFKAGTAEILGQFKLDQKRLVVELAHIDGGGEGVLPMLWSLAEQLARKRGCAEVEWIVHAVHCAKPNLKLRRLLELKGFTVENIEGVGEIYRYGHSIK